MQGLCKSRPACASVALLSIHCTFPVSKSVNIALCNFQQPAARLEAWASSGLRITYRHSDFRGVLFMTVGRFAHEAAPLYSIGTSSCTKRMSHAGAANLRYFRFMCMPVWKDYLRLAVGLPWLLILHSAAIIPTIYALEMLWAFTGTLEGFCQFCTVCTSWVTMVRSLSRIGACCLN